jgi:hypothetical protein
MSNVRETQYILECFPPDKRSFHYQMVVWPNVYSVLPAHTNDDGDHVMSARQVTEVTVGSPLGSPVMDSPPTQLYVRTLSTVTVPLLTSALDTSGGSGHTG